MSPEEVSNQVRELESARSQLRLWRTFVKMLACPRSGEVLGGACVGPVGGELIHEIVA